MRSSDADRCGLGHGSRPLRFVLIIYSLLVSRHVFHTLLLSLAEFLRSSLNVRFFSCRLIYGVCLFGASVCNMSDSHLLTYSGLGGVPL